ncbi:MAG: M28 family peptidase, partial [Verrucomicrobiota bacterium]
MDQQKLLTILRQVQSCPTAPFHEYHVRAKLEEMLGGVEGVSTRTDTFGNLLATYQQGALREGVWVLGAHMDHPGYVRDPEGGDWTFLGGVPQRVLDSGAGRKEFGDFAMWDLPAFEQEGEKIVSRVCDDLVGCAVIVALFMELAEQGVETKCHAVFTRGEEVGFWGAIQLAQRWPFQRNDVFLSLETSSPTPGVEFGKGPVVRAGDALSVFDSDTTADLV